MKNNPDKAIHLASPRMSHEGYELDYIKQAFVSNWIAPLGPNVEGFEKEFSQQLGVFDAAALSSGTAAIHLALKLVGVGEGIKPSEADARDPRQDLVLCSSLTFSASVNPIIYQGATPILIDSSPENWNMDVQALEIALDKYRGRVKAVLAVHLYGLLADIDQIQYLCDQHDVPLIEDAAESLGSSYLSYYYRKPGESSRSWQSQPILRQAGTAGDIGCFSFNGNKIITTSGGGMLTGNQEESAHAYCDKVRFWATQSREPAPWYQHEEIGYNYRMSNVCAGIGRGQLKVLDRHLQDKKTIFHYYKEVLEETGKVRMMPVPDGVYPNYWLSCCIFSDSIDPMVIYELLQERNIASRPIWKPMNLQPYFQHCEFVSTQPVGSVGQALFETGLCLPSDINMDQADLSKVTDLIIHAIKQA